MQVSERQERANQAMAWLSVVSASGPVDRGEQGRLRLVFLQAIRQ